MYYVEVAAMNRSLNFLVEIILPTAACDASREQREKGGSVDGWMAHVPFTLTQPQAKFQLRKDSNKSNKNNKHTYSCMHAHTHTHRHTHTNTHTHARTHALTHAHTHVRMHALIHTHIHMQAHARTHALTHAFLTIVCTVTCQN